jgi:hypothetical protein
MKKLFLFFLLICAVVLSAGEKLPKYIILFIGDGMSTPQRMMAEEFSRKTGKGELVINSADAPESNYTIALICDFDDIEGLNAYQVHPAHVEFAKFIGTVKTERACIDYEF